MLNLLAVQRSGAITARKPVVVPHLRLRLPQQQSVCVRIPLERRGEYRLCSRQQFQWCGLWGKKSVILLSSCCLANVAFML